MNKKETTSKSDFPLIVAPMFLISSPEMVVAACTSGAVGTFPCTNARTIQDLKSWMKSIKKNLQEIGCQIPWAANIITNNSYKRFEDELALIAEYQPPIVITALGSPKRVMETVKGYGGLVFADVNSIGYAKKCVDVGVDGLILVCSGAGGHTGALSPFVFVDVVRSFWDGTLILAGGISDGKGIKSALTLGADYAYMGTRFLAANESMAHEQYKQMVIDASIDDIITTKAITGVAGNFLKPSLIQAGYDLNNLQDAPIDFEEKKGEKKAWRDVWSAGQGVGAITQKESLASIINQLKKEYTTS